MMTANGRTSQPTPSKKLSSMPPGTLTGQLSRYSIVPQGWPCGQRPKLDKRFGTRLQLIRRSPHKRFGLHFWLNLSTVTLTVDSDLNNCYSCRSYVMGATGTAATALTETTNAHGVSVVYSVVCKLDALACSMPELFDLPCGICTGRN